MATLNSSESQPTSLSTTPPGTFTTTFAQIVTAQLCEYVNVSSSSSDSPSTSSEMRVTSTSLIGSSSSTLSGVSKTLFFHQCTFSEHESPFIPSNVIFLGSFPEDEKGVSSSVRCPLLLRWSTTSDSHSNSSPIDSSESFLVVVDPGCLYHQGTSVGQSGSDEEVSGVSDVDVVLGVLRPIFGISVASKSLFGVHLVQGGVGEEVEESQSRRMQPSQARAARNILHVKGFSSRLVSGPASLPFGAVVVADAEAESLFFLVGTNRDFPLANETVSVYLQDDVPMSMPESRSEEIMSGDIVLACCENVPVIVWAPNGTEGQVWVYSYARRSQRQDMRVVPMKVAAHKTRVCSVAINPSATLMATASQKGTLIRLFSISPPSVGEYSACGVVLLKELRRGLFSVRTMGLSFGVQHLVSVSHTGTVHIWRRPDESDSGKGFLTGWMESTRSELEGTVPPEVENRVLPMIHVIDEEPTMSLVLDCPSVGVVYLTTVSDDPWNWRSLDVESVRRAFDWTRESAACSDRLTSCLDPFTLLRETLHDADVGEAENRLERAQDSYVRARELFRSLPPPTRSTETRLLGESLYARRIREGAERVRNKREEAFVKQFRRSVFLHLDSESGSEEMGIDDVLPEDIFEEEGEDCTNEGENEADFVIVENEKTEVSVVVGQREELLDSKSEDMCRYERILSDAVALDFSDLKKLHVMTFVGNDDSGSPMILFKEAPFTEDQVARLLHFALTVIDPYASRDTGFVLLWAMDHRKLSLRGRKTAKPGLSFFLTACQSLAPKVLTNLKALYVIHPSFYSRLVFKFLRKWRLKGEILEKIHFVQDVYSPSCGILGEPRRLRLPASVILENVRRNKMKLDGDRDGGIWGVIGLDLCEVMLREENAGAEVPLFLEDCLRCIETVYIAREGLFRKSGAKHDVQEHALLINSGFAIDFCHSGPQTLTSLISLWLRELPDPVLTSALFYDFLTVVDMESQTVSTESLREVLKRLPQAHFRVAKRVFECLHRVCAHSDVNRMTGRNLAVCLAPAILRSRELGALEMVSYHGQMFAVVEALIVEDPGVTFSCQQADAI